jgi:hypothetical protein
MKTKTSSTLVSKCGSDQSPNGIPTSPEAIADIVKHYDGRVLEFSPSRNKVISFPPPPSDFDDPAQVKWYRGRLAEYFGIAADRANEEYVEVELYMSRARDQWVRLKAYQKGLE